MHIRLAHESDLAELATLFYQTVLEHAPQSYTPEQTQAWASFATETDAFERFILDATTYVAEDETGIVGFAGIEQNGHVSSAYVRGDRTRRGIGSALMQVLLNDAAQRQMPRLYAEASEFSLGLFKKFGFQLYDTEVVDRRGVQFTRYLVEKIRL
ncbi:GNAT family N-acetyltransferase [Egbenema bharatensis]|uniref:GNAT family N-acetyltransferase n=1 Tax=Egbenema bharatensis TaxID=3463334 RepID=UPI003A84981B